MLVSFCPLVTRSIIQLKTVKIQKMYEKVSMQDFYIRPFSVTCHWQHPLVTTRAKERIINSTTTIQTQRITWEQPSQEVIIIFLTEMYSTLS